MSALSLLETLQCRVAELEACLDQQGQAQRLSEARLSSLLSLSADWIWEQDEELRFTYLSDSIETTVGIQRDTLLGKPRMADQRYGAAPDEVARYRAAIDRHAAFRDFRFRFTRHDGVVCWFSISGEPVFDRAGTFKGYRGIGQDVTLATLAAQQVAQLASTDSLTGLPNRSSFLAELEHALARARRSGQPCAVCFLDIDRFKAINDTLGHAAGDELLKMMALRLRAALRASDIVARLGGDEFVVLLEGGDAQTDYARAGDKMLAAIREPLMLQQRSFHVTGSIGISLFPRHGSDAATLLQCADSAMYHAKDGGKNQVRLYSAELADQSARRFALESELRQALVHSELVLHYQPRVHIDSGRTVSVEALVRWEHPLRGLVSPGDFIPVAEDSGLIVAIGRWVMQQACRQLAAWRAQGLPVVPVAVNLSAKQFGSETLVDDLKDSMAFYGIEPGMIEVELTESALMAEPECANEVLQRFNNMGVKIAIDDFGTGYSSLSYLKRFPAQTVKIDRSFIAGLPGDSDDTVITQAVIAMAHSLGMAVVAEGVERPEQLEMLRRMGCDEAQGFLLGRPMPAEQLALRLAAR